MMTVHQLMQAVLDSGMDTDQICDLMGLKPRQLLQAFPYSMWDNRKAFFEALGIEEEQPTDEDVPDEPTAIEVYEEPESDEIEETEEFTG